MKIYEIQNTEDGARAYIYSPYDYQPGEIIYPHPDAHPALQGHEVNRWRIEKLVRSLPKLHIKED